MIRISNLNKIYKSKKRSKCHALKNINLNLPDTGLVFVLGKSGSGKSTLLNLIGGLDNITSGSIEVDGNDLAKFKERDFCNYRNTHIGFIFQDYHLIDELTIYENIVLSLNLKQTEVEDQVKQALEMVDLAGYENRYPTELSGGEQQRIAIARAIVKNPRIILADEPTGNLDTNTATAIITLLKKLSKKCLILIVSHNLNDANGYADRIIELKKGEIIYDKSRNPEFLDEMSLADGELIYPQGLALSDSDIAFINQNKGADFVKRTDKFLPTVPTEMIPKKTKIDNKHLKFGKQLHLSGIFLKNKALSISVSAFMVAVIMIIMALAQTIIAFDSGAIIAEEMVKSNQDTLFLNKGLDSKTQSKLNGSNYFVNIDQKDIQKIYNAGYQGKIYQGLTYTVPVKSSSIMNGRDDNVLQYSIYISQTLATLIVDEEFLENRFDEVNYCAKRDTFHPTGVIITDYIADAILLNKSNYRNHDYEYLIKNGYISDNNVYIINGIIETNYKETYKDLIEKLSNAKNWSDLNALYENTDFQIFLNDIYERLGYSYTLNQNFEENYLSAESSASPSFFKLVISHAAGTSESNNINYRILKNNDNGTKISDIDQNWRYTETALSIPQGTKYIRLSYYPSYMEKQTEELYGSKQSYPILVFDGAEAIGEEQFAFLSNQIINSNGELVHWSGAFTSDYIEIPENALITDFFNIIPKNYAYCAFYDADQNFIATEVPNSYAIDGESTMLVPASVYENLFPELVEKLGEDWVDKATPQNVKLSHCLFSDIDKKNPLFEKQVTIQIYNASAIRVSEDLFSLFYKDSIFSHSLYFDGTDGIGKALDAADAINLEPQSYTIEGIRTMTKAVDVFVPIFKLVAIFLCIGIIFIMVNFSSRMIHDKMHEIGILKALGVKNHSICSIFGMQVLLIAILTCVLASAGYYFFIGAANDVLIDSLKELAPARIVLDLNFLAFHWNISLINCVLVFALSVLSLIFPMIKIKMIKPVKIIKAKD